MKRILYFLPVMLCVLPLSCKTDTEYKYKTDVIPPSAISSESVSVAIGNRTVLLSWTNSPEEDFYGTRLNFTPAMDNVSQPIVIEGKAGESSKTVFKGLQNGTKYTFTLVAIDKSQNESAAVEISATPELETLNITLSIPEKLSNTTIPVTVAITSPAEITRVVYKKNGSENPKKLLEDADALEPAKAPDGTWTFDADEKTYWTVAAEDADGRQQTAQIYAKTIDIVPPVEVTNVFSQYSEAENTISITWRDSVDSQDEYDSPFDHVVISYTIDGGSEETYITTPYVRGTEAAIIESIQSDAEYYTFFVHAVDKVGNVSVGARSKLYISNIIYATADDVVQKISEMTQTGTVKVTGAYEIGELAAIVAAVKNLEEGIFIKLDLVDVTGLTSIGSAFEALANLKAIMIPNGVTYIPSFGFQNCSSLESVEIPGTVTRLGEHAFYGCSSLQEVNIPESVTSIEQDCFYGCTSLREMNISAGVTSIGQACFYGCSSLQKVNMPESVTSLGNYAFYGCSSLQEVNMPESVTSLGKGWFYGCTNLREIDIPAGVTSIEQDCFYGCTSLREMIIPASVTSIGIDAFYGCASLQEIDIPAGVTSIGGGSFHNCTGLLKVNIFANMTVGSFGSVFYGCLNLQEVNIASGVTRIDDYAFSQCTGLQKVTIADSVTSIGDEAFFGCTSLQKIDIPASVTRIGERAFMNCTNLQKIDIPASVTSISENCFYGCTSLREVNIPVSVTSIGIRAFQSCTSLQKIDIPASVMSISTSAFFMCRKLQEIDIAEGVSSIGIYAFYECSSLKRIDIPASVSSIGEHAFYWCNVLSVINFAGSVAQWNAIEKGDYWNGNVPATKVVCSDGEVDL